jgi:hypothetical protein
MASREIYAHKEFDQKREKVIQSRSLEQHRYLESIPVYPSTVPSFSPRDSINKAII